MVYSFKRFYTIFISLVIVIYKQFFKLSLYIVSIDIDILKYFTIGKKTIHLCYLILKIFFQLILLYLFIYFLKKIKIISEYVGIQKLIFQSFFENKKVCVSKLIWIVNDVEFIKRSWDILVSKRKFFGNVLILKISFCTIY